MTDRGRRASRLRVGPGVTLLVAVVVALVVRSQAVVGIAALFVVFVPLEKLCGRRRQRVFRRGVATDLTHLLVNGIFVAAGATVVALVLALPLIWVRSFAIAGRLPGAAAVALAATMVVLGNYWGHRLTHTVPLLWRFHSVHHSIDEMDWLASGRLHPFDSAFTQGFALAPLVVAGYGGGAFAGVGAVVTLLALFQHANVRLRLPVLRWVIPTPEWHHWHHAVDAPAVDTNFGLPLVDALFGTAYLPRDRVPTGFGITDPVPVDAYLRQMVHPFTAAARPVARSRADVRIAAETRH